MKSIITDDDVWNLFFATGLSVRVAMHISETLAKSINGKSFLSACFAGNGFMITVTNIVRDVFSIVEQS